LNPFVDLISQNQFVSGGITLVLFTAALAACRRVPFIVYGRLKSLLITIIEVEEDSGQIYRATTDWLSTNEVLSRKTRNISLTSDLVSPSSKEILAVSELNEEIGKMVKDRESAFMPVVRMSLGFGVHWFFYRKVPVVIIRHREKRAESGSAAEKAKYVFLILSRNRSFIRQLFQMIAIKSVPIPRKKNSINIWSYGTNGWAIMATKPLRDKSSVIIGDGIMDQMIDDVAQFIASECWYRSVGVPYRRGYLLHGPPGNGKSSIVHAIASHLKEDVSIISLSGSSIRDENLLSTINSSPGRILLMEDIDAVRISDDRSKNTPPSEVGDMSSIINAPKVSLSGLINAMDGVAAQEGKIVIMTTNHPDKLDPALIRPGRCDVKFYIPNATRSQIASMFMRFFPESDQDMAKSFSMCFEECEKSMAYIQEHLMSNRSSADEALASACRNIYSVRNIA
jgi:chaperone BCS1